jgi:hypothetical protein
LNHLDSAFNNPIIREMSCPIPKIVFTSGFISARISLSRLAFNLEDIVPIHIELRNCSAATRVTIESVTFKQQITYKLKHTTKGPLTEFKEKLKVAQVFEKPTRHVLHTVYFPLRGVSNTTPHHPSKSKTLTQSLSNSFKTSKLDITHCFVVALRAGGSEKGKSWKIEVPVIVGGFASGMRLDGEVEISDTPVPLYLSREEYTA